jgi:hypothetical protein
MKLLERLAPGVSRHPWVWDLVRARRSRHDAVLLNEQRERPFEELDLLAPGLPAGFQYMRTWEGRQALWQTDTLSRIHPARGWVITRPLTLEDRASGRR